MSEGMVCTQCGEELPTATRRSETAGGLVYFAGNRFCHSHLTKEAAQLRRSKAKAPKEKRDDASRLAEAVLAVASAPEDEEARTEARERLVSALSQIATGGKSAASVTAITALAARAGELLSASRARPPGRDEPCPLCGRTTLVPITVSEECLRAWEVLPKTPLEDKPYPYMAHDDGDEDDEPMMAVED